MSSNRCLQGASSPDPTTVYVDLRALRNDRVTLTERGAPHSLALMESGKLLPGVNVIIANPVRISVFRDNFPNPETVRQIVCQTSNGAVGISDASA